MSEVTKEALDAALAEHVEKMRAEVIPQILEDMRRDARPPEPEKRRKASYVGAPAIFALTSACQDINRAFGGFGCYLVGSALERPDWRDVDVRYIMSDEEFEAEFPHTLHRNDDGSMHESGGGTWEHDPKWLLLTISISERLRALTGLPIDFQFQPQTHANRVHKGPRNALGLRFAKPTDD